MPQEPRIIFWCQNCDDYPIIEGEEYHGYPIEGIEFVERRNTFLDRRDEKGDIFFPLVGTIHAQGLTIGEFRQLLTQRLSKFIKDPQIVQIAYQQAQAESINSKS
jgi:hypothetical protein